MAKNYSTIAKLKDKTQNSRKKLKLWEDFSAPERPSDVKTKSLPYMHTIFAGKITKLRVCLFVNVHSINLGRLLFGENCDYCQLGGISN